MLILCFITIYISSNFRKLLSVSLVKDRSECILLVFLTKFISLEKLFVNRSWKLTYEIDIEETLVEKADYFRCEEAFEIVKKGGSITLFTLLKKLKLTKKIFPSSQLERNILKFKTNVLIDKNKNLFDLKGNLREMPTEKQIIILEKIKTLLKPNYLHIRTVPENISSFGNSEWKLEYVIGFAEKEHEQDFVIHLSFSSATEPFEYFILNICENEAACERIEKAENKQTVLKEIGGLKCSPTIVEYKKPGIN